MHTKEENLALRAKTKKGRKPFAPKKSLHTKKKEIDKGFDKSKLLCFYCQKLGHFIRDCHVKKRKEGRFHASTAVEETSKEDAPKEKETRREYYLVSALFGSLITGEDTWLIDIGASKHMSRPASSESRGVITLGAY